MKAFKSLICFVLAIAMVLSMSTMIFAVEEPKVYLAIGDSVSLGVKDGEYACSFTRVSGSSVDLLAKKLDMPVMPVSVK